MESAAAGRDLLEARGLSKAFPGVKALDGVDLTLSAGEVHGLLGENGAGKSTLIQLLTGALPCDAGTIRLDGREIRPRSIPEARREGLTAVYQEIDLLPNLTVAQNLLLGREPTRFGLVRHGEMNRMAREMLAPFGLDIDVTCDLGDYSVAVQQLVAIARAVAADARVLILDEPTASLDARETEALFRVMRQLKQQGVALVFVTHFLDQVYAICDRITVLRNGALVGTKPAAELPRGELISMMLGKELSGELGRAHAARKPQGEPFARFERLGRKRRVEPFDLDFRPGEAVGAAGLLGSGRTETALLMFGAERADTGKALIDGRERRIRGPRDAIRLGFGFSPEERKTDGVVGQLSVRENIMLALQAKRSWLRPLGRRRQREICDALIRRLNIRTSDAEKPIRQLSGGNQQKALIARWLAVEPRLLILDEPTRGVDIGAHAEIMRAIDALCADGMALYVISSEVEEIAAAADRVSVMCDRRQVKMLEGDDVSPQAIIAAIATPAAEPAP
jgi:simple sugar transport system ATP-binding protein